MIQKSFALSAIIFFSCAAAHALNIGPVQTKKEREFKSSLSSRSSQKDFEKIVSLFLSENFSQAEMLSAKFINKNKGTALADEAAYYRALSLMKMSRYDQARPLLSALEQEGLTPEIRGQAAFSLGDSHYFALGENGSRMRAQAYYREALRKYPSAGEAETIRKVLGLSEAKPPVSALPMAQQYAVENAPIAIYTVQVGSFSRERNAEKLLKKLMAKGYDAYILPDPDKQSYRVRAGRLEDLEEARDLEKKLKKDRYPTKIFP